MLLETFYIFLSFLIILSYTLRGLTYEKLLGKKIGFIPIFGDFLSVDYIALRRKIKLRYFFQFTNILMFLIIFCLIGWWISVFLSFFTTMFLKWLQGIPFRKESFDLMKYSFHIKTTFPKIFFFIILLNILKTLLKYNIFICFFDRYNFSKKKVFLFVLFPMIFYFYIIFNQLEKLKGD